MLFLSGEDVQSVLTMKDAICAVEDAFREFALGNARMPVRSSVTIQQHRGLMLTMPAYVGAVEALGQKIVTVYPENLSKHNLPTILATVQLLDPETGECLAFLEGTYLTAMRTGAASAIATKYLARRDAAHVAIFGAGVQAETQLEAISEVRGIELAKIYDPVAQRAAEYCQRMSRRIGIEVESAQNAREAVRDSDIVICASTSRTPVFNGEWLEPGVHINGIGSHTSDTREVDTVTVQRSKVIVDSRESALAEAGDLLLPIAENAISSEHIWAELGDIVTGKREGRTSDQEITLFKSVGIAIQDVSVALAVYRKAIQQGRGAVLKIRP